MLAVTTKIKKKKNKLQISTVFVFINATFNNTLIYISDSFGNVLAWSTSGNQGFKGSRKSTPYAASVAAKIACKKVVDMCIVPTSGKVNIFAEIFIKGPGPGSESAVRSVGGYFSITKISNITGIPHNGCRPKKVRRV